MVLIRLALSNFRVHKIRMALTVAAVALSVSLVVAVTSGYASVMAAAEKFMDEFLGATDAQITQRDETRSGIPESIVAELRKDPRVKRVNGRLETDSRLLDKDGQAIMRMGTHVIGIHRKEDDRIDRLRVIQGRWFNDEEGKVAVIDQGVAQRLDVKVGQTIALPNVNGALTLKVVGIIHKPGFFAAHVQTVYLPIATLQRFIAPDLPPYVSRVMINLAPGVNLEQFRTDWESKLAGIDQNLHLRLTRDNRKDLDRNLEGIHLLSMMGGVISMIAATFIVFSSLSMGVTERQRTLAMLRAIGTLRRQVAALVIFEGLLLGILGVILGVVLGWTWVKLLSLKFPNFFAAGVHLDRLGLLMGGAGSIAAATLASILPAWSASRVDPLEAMSPLSTPPSRRVPRRAAIAGLILICIDPAILSLPWSREISIYGHFIVGVPCLMLGFFLLAPLFVIVIEMLATRPVAQLFAINPALLRQQLSAGLWRVAGTCAALMVGLAVLVVMQTQGQSFLHAWKLPDKFPDIFIYSRLSQMRLADMPKVEQIPGIKEGEVMPITVSSPEFGSNPFAIAGALLVPNATMFFGVDPDRGLDMIELDFREGNKEDARRMLKQGRHLIITQALQKLKNYHVGDKITLKSSRHGTVEYTIAGAVWSPGLDVMVGVFDLSRQFEQRTIDSVFGSIADAREDFGADGAYVFAANLDPTVSKDTLIKEVRKKLGMLGLDAGDVRQIKANIHTGFTNILLFISSVAFAAMAVSSLGVANTVMAGIRTRRWQFGILRSIGVTRSQLLRLVLAEAALLGIIGCVLGLVAGLEMSLDARLLSQVTLGLALPLVIPWNYILIGVASVLFVTALASIWPAIGVARQEPLSLLQAGRAAA